MVRAINSISFQGQFRPKLKTSFVRDTFAFNPSGEFIEGKNLQPKSKKTMGCDHAEGCSAFLMSS